MNDAQYCSEQVLNRAAWGLTPAYHYRQQLGPVLVDHYISHTSIF